MIVTAGGYHDQHKHDRVRRFNDGNVRMIEISMSMYPGR
jgi:hypothetical protein